VNPINCQEKVARALGCDYHVACAISRLRVCLPTAAILAHLLAVVLRVGKSPIFETAGEGGGSRTSCMKETQLHSPKTQELLYDVEHDR
jgi:hypothetical protein